MSKKAIGKPLTADMVFTKTKSDSLHNIININLWGNDLEDLSLIHKMPNLEVISLSVNKISTLKYFSHCPKLHELYLRKNSIEDIREIRYLMKLPSLKILWLYDNPCADVENYRQIVIKHLPNLVKLDNNPVTPQEKSSAELHPYRIVMENQSKAEFSEEKWHRPASGHSNLSQRKQQDYEKREISYADPQASEEKWKKKQEPSVLVREEDINRNQNVLMAVLSLMRELDPGSLQIVKNETDKLLH